MPNELINTAALRSLLEQDSSIEACARSMSDVEGYLLYLSLGDEVFVLSTYLTDKPRLFKRADALLKEAQKVGLEAVTFEFD